MELQEIRDRVAAQMPAVLDDLTALVEHASIAFPGYPEEPVHAMAQQTVELFRAAGITDARLMEVPEGYPPIYGELQGPPGSPVVMLYAHYDVQPAPPEQGWTSDPWTPTRKDDGRIYGRGAADDKSGLVTHLGTLRAFDGAPPCTVRLIVEGMEETNSNLEAFVEANPELFAGVDLFVICDMGNLRVGEPVLTSSLRGDVACIVTVSTLEHPLHSGVFGGPAPDAMIAMARLLATLHDDDGNVAIDGVSRFEWDGANMTSKEFADSADLLDGVDVIGHESAGTALWSQPSVNAIGLDMTSIAGSSNVLIPVVKAKISMRIVPGSEPDQELDALVHHLETHAPWGAQVAVERTKAAPPFRCATDGPGIAAARAALTDAYGSEPSEVGSGGSIPLPRTGQVVAPGAGGGGGGRVAGAAAPCAAAYVSLDPAEIEAMTVAQVSLLQRLAVR